MYLGITITIKPEEVMNLRESREMWEELEGEEKGVEVM